MQKYSLYRLSPVDSYIADIECRVTQIMKPNILLVVLDATRADHTSIDGYSRETTPNLEELVKDGYNFSQAFSAAPWTPPSHGSLFSGVYPSNHRYLDGGMPFSPPHPSLPAHLKELGYHTFGAARNPKIGGSTEVTKGFDEFADLYKISSKPSSLEEFKKYYFDLYFGWFRTLIRGYGTDRWPAEYITLEYIKNRIRQYAESPPFFGFVNINAPHSRYAPPDPFLEKFETFDRGEMDMDLIRDLAYRGGYRFMGGELEPQEEEWNAVIDWYDGEIGFADSLVGEIISELKRQNVYKDTIVIVTADHGEHFGEHGRAYHQFSLFDELLHVPLVIKPHLEYEPDNNAENRLTSLVDVFPTILDMLEETIPSSVDGSNIFCEKDTRNTIFAEYGEPKTAISTLKNECKNSDGGAVSKLNNALRCARTEDRKYIRVEEGEGRVYKVGETTPKDELLYKGADKELDDIMSRLLPEDLSTDIQQPEDHDVQKQLEQLGYR